MKLKEFFYLLGLKPRDRHYGYELRTVELPDFGAIEYAQWLHPSAYSVVLNLWDFERLKEFLSEGDFCIDIGAHGGDTTLPMALAVGASGLTLALEPNPFVFPVLNKNSVLNRSKTNIVPLMVAATEKDGDLEFDYGDAGYCNGGRHEKIGKWTHGAAFTLRVCGVQLSSFLRERFPDRLANLKYIKIDAEGYDLNILRSIEDIINEFQPRIVVEVSKHTSPKYREDMYAFFSAKNYQVFKLSSQASLTKECKLTASETNNWAHYDIFCIPPEAERNEGAPNSRSKLAT